LPTLLEALLGVGLLAAIGVVAKRELMECVLDRLRIGIAGDA
jgi:hypothetical protein